MERLDDFVEVVIVNDPSEQPLDLANLMCDTARPNDDVEATWASSDAGKHWRCAPGKSTLCRMAIHLTKELEAETDAKVRSGVYRSADEVIREGLELINAREELRQAIAEGASQLDRGEGVPGEQVFEELRKRSQELRSKAK